MTNEFYTGLLLILRKLAVIANLTLPHNAEDKRAPIKTERIKLNVTENVHTENKVLE